jgi:hypothetical protein
MLGRVTPPSPLFFEEGLRPNRPSLSFCSSSLRSLFSSLRKWFSSLSLQFSSSSL